jgi:hypothetical protein
MTVDKMIVYKMTVDVNEIYEHEMSVDKMTVAKYLLAK